MTNTYEVEQLNRTEPTAAHVGELNNDNSCSHGSVFKAVQTEAVRAPSPLQAPELETVWHAEQATETSLIPAETGTRSRYN